MPNCVEFLVVEMFPANQMKLYDHKEFQLAGVSGRTAIYEVALLPFKTGAFRHPIASVKHSVRMLPVRAFISIEINAENIHKSP